VFLCSAVQLQGYLLAVVPAGCFLHLPNTAHSCRNIGAGYRCEIIGYAAVITKHQEGFIVGNGTAVGGIGNSYAAAQCNGYHTGILAAGFFLVQQGTIITANTGNTEL